MQIGRGKNKLMAKVKNIVPKNNIYSNKHKQV